MKFRFSSSLNLAKVVCCPSYALSHKGKSYRIPLYKKRSIVHHMSPLKCIKTLSYLFFLLGAMHLVFLFRYCLIIIEAKRMRDCLWELYKHTLYIDFHWSIDLNGVRYCSKDYGIEIFGLIFIVIYSCLQYIGYSAFSQDFVNFLYYSTE